MSPPEPWARHKSRFCKNFEDEVAWLASGAPQTVVSRLKRIEWHTVGEIYGRVWKELEAKSPSRFEGLENIGIDETSYKKGHKYMTVVMNHDTNAVVWVSAGHGKAVLSRFFELLTEEQRASIRRVSADAASWIASCVEEYCPNAERCVDPFHVVSWATEILDEERRKAWSEARKTAKEAPKRGRGRPPKGEEAAPGKKTAKELKGLRYVLLKNPESLHEGQQAQLKLLAEAHPRLYRAYLLKEGLRAALKAGADGVEYALKKWMDWAQRCRIPAFRELRAKIKRHYNGIVAAIKNGLTNARMEAMNNKIKVINRRAYGFRNMDNLIARSELCCSDIRPMLPGRQRE